MKKIFLILSVLILFCSFAFAEDDEECPAHSHPEGDNCYCDSGYVASGGSCISCGAYCSAHDSNSHGIIMGSQCGCECNSGYFIPVGGGYCVSCDAKCNELYQNTYGVLEGDSCNCKCKEGFVDVDGLCVQPDADCDNSCKEVNPDYMGMVNDDICYCKCKDELYDVEGDCLTEAEYNALICNDACAQMDPHAEGSMTGDNCYCGCEDGYLEIDQSCVSETEYLDEMCNSFCEDTVGNAYGIMYEEGCNCYCEPGYEYIDGKCISLDQQCDANCKAADFYSYGLVQSEECGCFCLSDYFKVEGKCTSAKSICDGQCKTEDSNSYGVADGEDCDCYCTEGYVLENGICVPGTELTAQECDNYCSGSVPNTDGVMKSDGCYCECKDGFVASGGSCEPAGNAPSKEEMEEKFNKKEMSPNKPNVPPMDEKTKEKIKDYLGLDIDEYGENIGAGKKAYIIRSNDLSSREATSLGTKANLMITFFKELGYDVRYVDRESSEQVFDAMTDENAGAVAYFGHSEKNSPAIENQGAENLPTYLANAKARWYQLEGMSKLDATKKANNNAQNAHLDFFFAHTCYSADPGYEAVADQILNPGGIYIGQEGILWSVDYPDVEYMKK